MLMAGLEVPNEAFFRLQSLMLQKLVNILVDENEAIEAICQVKNIFFFKSFYTNSGNCRWCVGSGLIYITQFQSTELRGTVL